MTTKRRRTGRKPGRGKYHPRLNRDDWGRSHAFTCQWCFERALKDALQRQVGDWTVCVDCHAELQPFAVNGGEPRIVVGNMGMGYFSFLFRCPMPDGTVWVKREAGEIWGDRNDVRELLNPDNVGTIALLNAEQWGEMVNFPYGGRIL